MPAIHKSNFFLLIQRLMILMLLFSVCRVLFLLFNHGYFRESPGWSILADFFFGLRFDAAAIVMSNIVLISLHFFPFSFFYSRAWQGFISVLFYAVNIPLLLFNCIDLGLFRFSGKRATTDVFRIMSFGEDFTNTLPRMILDFWYLLLLFVGLVLLMIRLYQRTGISAASAHPADRFLRNKWIRILSFPIFLVLTVIGWRGGIQYKPINILTASRYGTGQEAALVLNTPFTILKTIGKDELKEMYYFPEEKLARLAPVQHASRPGAVFRPMNVIIIILESFGKEYIGALNQSTGFTPFLDSLMKQSLVFENAFANGKRSIEGIPAILAGIPALMSEPYITSPYAANTISSIATCLKQKGYTSSFFHGGTNGTMGFDNFVKLAGFDRYFGRKEYNNDMDFDGAWGIADEPFLQRFVLEMDHTKQPFLSAVFTISSHHPYKIPDKFRNVFPEGTLPIHRSLRYTDYSLRRFFETASRSSWYDSTLFVITADHTALSEKPFYQNRAGMYAVPIIFFSPSSDLHGMSRRTTQHIDILPSILDYLGYDQAYFSFGTSVFDSSATGYAVNYLNDSYQLLEDGYSLLLDTLQKNSLYHYTTDSLLRNNLIDSEAVRSSRMEEKLKAIIQSYNWALLHNHMTAHRR